MHFFKLNQDSVLYSLTCLYLLSMGGLVQHELFCHYQTIMILPETKMIMVIIPSKVSLSLECSFVLILFNEGTFPFACPYIHFPAYSLLMYVASFS